MSVFTNRAAEAPEQAKHYVSAILELLGDRNPLEVLTHTPTALHWACDGLSPEQLGRQEASGKWSIRQVLAHLADSELVSGYRLRLVLAQERPAVSGYDQDLWTSRLRYDHADPRLSVEQFNVLRRANLALIGNTSEADRQRVGVHSERGEESVELMIRLVAGHDLLHLKHIARIRAAIGALV